MTRATRVRAYVKVYWPLVLLLVVTAMAGASIERYFGPVVQRVTVYVQCPNLPHHECKFPRPS